MFSSLYTLYLRLVGVKHWILLLLLLLLGSKVMVIVTELISYVLSHGIGGCMITQWGLCEEWDAAPTATLSPCSNEWNKAAWGAGPEPTLKTALWLVLLLFCQWWYSFSKTLVKESISTDKGINNLETLSLCVLTVSIQLPLPQDLNRFTRTCLHGTFQGMDFTQGYLRHCGSKG